MADTTFWCDYELDRFPIAELAKDADGNPVHQTADGPCHHPNGNLCREPSAPGLLIRWYRLSPAEQEALWQQLERR